MARHIPVRAEPMALAARSSQPVAVLDEPPILTAIDGDGDGLAAACVEHPELRERAACLTAPALVVSFDDDFYAPRAAADVLASWYGPRGATRPHVHPRDVGARALGHFGCFRPAHRDGLRADAIRWLEQRTTTAQRGEEERPDVQ